MIAFIDLSALSAVPFHFWTVVLFVLGCCIGSFLNVCIHRMPLGQSIIKPPSHCPHCKYSIPWYLNLPLVTWMYLKGRCANCKAPISSRYFLVELLTGTLFCLAWITSGRYSPGLALAYCLLLSGFVVATFIDFEHFIIPDEITLGGIVVGFICSFIVPDLHGATAAYASLKQSTLGILIGGGAIYLVLRLGKVLFGRQKLELPPNTQIVFTETALVLPDQEIPYESVFYRKSDVIVVEAKMVEMIDRCYKSVQVRLAPEKLMIGDEVLNPEEVPHLEVLADQVVLPREAMGFGDVKFLAAIGAFLGWQASLFSLMVSSFIGALVGLILILCRKQEWSAKIPYGPYIAVAATIWVFGGSRLVRWWLEGGMFQP